MQGHTFLYNYWFEAVVPTEVIVPSTQLTLASKLVASND